MTECPVCFEDTAATTLVCGHRMCARCVKEWYLRNGTTCPMCRRPMYFKGMRRKIKNWTDEKRTVQIDSIYGDYVDSIIDMHAEVDYDDFIMFSLELFEYQFNRAVMYTDDPDYIRVLVENFYNLEVPPVTRVVCYTIRMSVAHETVSKKKGYIFKKSIYNDIKSKRVNNTV